MHPPTSRTLITGASSGLGAGLARRLAQRGHEVWLVARRRELLEQTVREIRASGGQAHALALDLSDFERTFSDLYELDRTSAGFDLVIANAGVAGLPAALPAGRAPWSNTSEIVRVNLCGAIATLSAFIPGMLARGHGQLVGVSSLAATLPNPRMPAYGATKAGLSFWLDSIDMELRPRGIAVTAIEPGFIRTPAADGVREPMPFILESEAAVSVIERAIQRRARRVRFPWQLQWLLRAAALLPRSLTRTLIKRWAMPAPALSSPPVP